MHYSCMQPNIFVIMYWICQLCIANRKIFILQIFPTVIYVHGIFHIACGQLNLIITCTEYINYNKISIPQIFPTTRYFPCTLFSLLDSCYSIYYTGAANVPHSHSPCPCWGTHICWEGQRTRSESRRYWWSWDQKLAGSHLNKQTTRTEYRSESN
jgi:hypothetical protein